jgi:hypothetical protein
MASTSCSPAAGPSTKLAATARFSCTTGPGDTATSWMTESPETAYFPSIEKKYGQPISSWIELINQTRQSAGTATSSSGSSASTVSAMATPTRWSGMPARSADSLTR